MIDPEHRGRLFRILLGVGATASVALGVWGVFVGRMLESVLGLRVPVATPGFDALGRMYGGVMLALGVGYGLAAAQPHRSRSLLVVLFVAPLVTATVVIAGTSRGEIAPWHGAAFAAFNIVYCLVFFRTYPRLEEPRPAPPDELGLAQPDEPPVT